MAMTRPPDCGDPPRTPKRPQSSLAWDVRPNKCGPVFCRPSLRLSGNPCFRRRGSPCPFCRITPGLGFRFVGPRPVRLPAIGAISPASVLATWDFDFFGSSTCFPANAIALRTAFSGVHGQSAVPAAANQATHNLRVLREISEYGGTRASSKATRSQCVVNQLKVVFGNRWWSGVRLSRPTDRSSLLISCSGQPARGRALLRFHPPKPPYHKIYQRGILI